MSDFQRAKLLAAARRVSPLNKEVFLIEYNLTLGKKSPGIDPIPRESVNRTLAPYLQLLSGKPNSTEFFNYISTTIDHDAASSQLKRKRVYRVTDRGYSKLSADFGPIEVSRFEFVPNSIDSRNFVSAYRESLKFLSLQNEAKLSGWRIEFTDELETAGGKSEALPCAVLTKAFLDQIELDSEVAYIGDVNADGSVQPIGDLYSKLEGRDIVFSKVTIIPKGDLSSLSDILILVGPKIFASTQLFSVSRLDEAIELGKKSRTAQLNESMTLFSEIQKSLKAPNGGKSIYTSEVQNTDWSGLGIAAESPIGTLLKSHFR